MCGRFTLMTPFDVIARQFQLLTIQAALAESYRPRFNIAPGQQILTVTAENARGGDSPGGELLRTLGARRWGLIPPWAKDPAIGYRMINARSETVAQKPSFRHAFRRRRCLVPADGFYEWRAEGRRKLPYRFRLKDGSLFALAGLWEIWTPPGGGEPVTTCTVLTTDANDVVGPVHHRMPVILRPEHYDAWLDPAEDPRALQSLLTAYPASAMEGYPVSPEVNAARNDYPSLIEPHPHDADPGLSPSGPPEGAPNRSVPAPGRDPLPGEPLALDLDFSEP